MNRDIYQAITERFIEQLKRGTVPWQKPWFAVQNIVSRKPYRGINALLLGSTDYQSPFWITFKQALDLGGHVKKGEKSTPVIYYKILEKRDEAGNPIVREDGRPARIPFVRWANVFNLDQTEGIHHRGFLPPWRRHSPRSARNRRREPGHEGWVHGRREAISWTRRAKALRDRDEIIVPILCALGSPQRVEVSPIHVPPVPFAGPAGPRVVI